MTDERIASIYLDIEKGKAALTSFLRIVGYITLAIAALMLVTFLVHLAFPQIEWLWRQY